MCVVVRFSSHDFFPYCDACAFRSVCKLSSRIAVQYSQNKVVIKFARQIGRVMTHQYGWMPFMLFIPFVRIY